MSLRSTSRKSRSKQEIATARRIIAQEGELILSRLRALFWTIEHSEFACEKPINPRELCPMKAGAAGIDEELKKRILEEIGALGQRLAALLKSINGLDS